MMLKRRYYEWNTGIMKNKFINARQDLPGKKSSFSLMSGKSASSSAGKYDGRIFFKIAGEINRVAIAPILYG